MKYIKKLLWLIKSNKVKLSYLPLYIFLRLLSLYLLKNNSRILTFNLSEKLPQFSGYKLSGEGFKISSEVCLLLQGPISKLNYKINQDFAKYAKENLGVGYVIYCGPDIELMKDFCDEVHDVNVGKEKDPFRLQQFSTLLGLKKVDLNKYKYTLKLRADAIVLRRDAILLFIARLNENIKNKIVVISQQKPYYSPFMSDHLQFGLTVDLITLWSKKWNGYLSLNAKQYDEEREVPEDVYKYTEEVAPTAEWVLGQSFKESFPGKEIAICSDYEIYYKLLKYDFYDVYNFDWESSPHFSKINIYPSSESNITHVEKSIVNYFKKEVYEKSFQF